MILLLKNRVLMMKNRVARMGYGDVAKVFFFGGLGFLFLAALYWGFMRLLWEVKSVEIIGGLLVAKLTAMVFLTTFSMLIFSSCLASFSTLFFARDLALLIHSPLDFRTVFLFKALETSLFASWMVALAMAPFLGAYGRVYDQGPAFYAVLGALSIPYVLTATLTGVLISLVLVSLFPSRRVREVMLILGAVLGCAIYVLMRWLAPERLVRADSLDAVVQYVSLLEAPTARFLPSWWMAEALTAFVAGRWGEVAREAALLVAGASLMAASLGVLAGRSYYRGWTAAQEAPHRKHGAPLGSEWGWIPRWVTPPFRAMLGKDGLLFARDPNQWTQLLMLVSLAAVYLISVRNLPLDSPFLKSLISFLNIGTAGFVLASVALRFVYPSVSLEGKSWWALRASPLGIGTILWGKVLGGFAPLAVLGVALVGVSNRLLGVDPFIARLSEGTLLVMAFTLTGMGVGFGALFPRFQVENVAEIESSPGGLLYMASAMFYVGATLALESVLVKRLYLGRAARLGVDGWGALGALAALNLLAFAVPFLGGKRHLETTDL